MKRKLTVTIEIDLGHKGFLESDETASETREYSKHTAWGSLKVQGHILKKIRELMHKQVTKGIIDNVRYRCSDEEAHTVKTNLYQSYPDHRPSPSLHTVGNYTVKVEGHSPVKDWIR